MSIFTVIIYSVFFTQIMIISFYLPTKFRRFRRQLFEEHPQSEFPKLYYQPFKIELRRQKIRKILDLSIGFAALTALFFTLSNSYSNQQVTEVMFFTAIVEILPFILSQYWGRKNSQLMKKMPQPQKRITFLVARKLIHYVEPMTIALATIMYITAMLLGGYVYWNSIGFDNLFSFESSGLISLLLFNTFVAIYVSILLSKALYEKREDQNLSNEDRLLFMRKKINQLIQSIILYSLFTIGAIMIKMYGLERNTVYVLASVCLQVIMLIKVNPTKERDFSVYRQDEID